jgi:hypothetical protein
VPGATSAPCAAWTELVTWMQRLQPGLAAKWVSKGLTMDLYLSISIYIYIFLGKNMVKELGFLHFFSKLIHCILKRWNIPVIFAAVP